VACVSVICHLVAGTREYRSYPSSPNSSPVALPVAAWRRKAGRPGLLGGASEWRGGLWQLDSGLALVQPKGLVSLL
jgi:hypothetical protein